MKHYTFKIILKEGSDEFWEGIDGAGCAEVYTEVYNALAARGFIGGSPDCLVKLVEFTDDEL